MSDGEQIDPPNGHEGEQAPVAPAARKRRISPVLVVLLIALAALAGAATRRLQRHVTLEPTFCLSCHAPVAKDLGAHGHAKLDCGSCHRSDFGAGLKLLVVPGSGASTPHGQVDLARCKTCHFDQRKDSKTAKSIGHQNHVTAKVHLTCDKCHQLKRHAEPIDPKTCHGCHDKVEVHEHGMTEVACLSCHQFIKEGHAGDPGATGCPTCHSGKPLAPGQTFTSTKSKPITAAVVHGNVNACRLCHEPHRPDPTNRRHGNDCASCHRRVVDQHREAGIVAHMNCAECHAVHGPRPKTPELCIRCHSAEVGKPSDNRLAARHEGCAGCHAAHLFRPKAARCIECHKPVQAVLATWKSAPHADCLNCHSGHSGKDPASACPTCHQAQRAHGHERCTTCHEPHKDRSSAKTCANCHQPVFGAVATAKAPPHRMCASCHATHAAPQALQRCAGCHGKQADQVARAAPPAHQSCKSCHFPHQFTASGAVCRNCHRPSDLGAHRDNCTKCHERHGPPGRPSLVCNNCHTGQGSGHGHHTDCLSCHSVHRHPQGGPACVACHRGKVAAANTWRPVAHQKCDSCHERHVDSAPKSCANCHADKTSQPLPKGHRCLGCHNPHQSPTLNSGLCSNCHAGQAASVSGGSPTHVDCIKCHKPHESRRPTCQGCHQVRQGAHLIKGHQNCSNCHATHDVRSAGRAKCINCHKDKTNHYPKAANCIACHAFR